MHGPTPPVPPSPAQPSPPYTEFSPQVAYPGLPRQATAAGGYLAHPGPGAAPFPSAAPVAHPKPSTSARVGLFVLRAVLACVPICTIGILSWVPLIRTAFVRRRAWDWAALIGTALLSSAALVAVGTAPNEDGTQTTVGMITLLLLGAGSTVHFLVAELRTTPASQPAPQPAHLLHTYGQPYGSPWQAAPTAPLVPLVQVQAELDELSALLHGHERPAP